MTTASTIKASNGEKWNTLKISSKEKVKMVGDKDPKSRTYTLYSVTGADGTLYHMGKAPGKDLFTTGAGFAEKDGKPSDTLVLYAKPVKPTKGLETVAVLIDPVNNEVSIHEDVNVRSVEIIYN